MKVTDKGLAFVAAHEGVVTKAYRCPAGVWTIGVGHTSAAGAPKVTAGMRITREEAFAILGRDIGKFEARVAAALPTNSATVNDGAVSFDFNTGAIIKASWPKLFRSDRTRSEASLKQWNKGGGKVLKGLVRRRAEEGDLIFRGKYPSGLDPVAVPDDRAASISPAEVASYRDVLCTLGWFDLPSTASFDAVKAWQAAHGLAADGIVGKQTLGKIAETLDRAVRGFQAANGLVVDGIVGPATRASLQRALEARASTRVALVTGGTGGAADAGVQITSAPDVAGAVTDPGAVPDQIGVPAVPSDLPVPVDGGGLHILISGALTAVAVFGFVWLGFFLWRHRGVVTGRRIPT